MSGGGGLARRFSTSGQKPGFEPPGTRRLCLGVKAPGASLSLHPKATPPQATDSWRSCTAVMRSVTPPPRGLCFVAAPRPQSQGDRCGGCMTPSRQPLGGSGGSAAPQRLPSGSVRGARRAGRTAGLAAALVSAAVERPRHAHGGRKHGHCTPKRRERVTASDGASRGAPHPAGPPRVEGAGPRARVGGARLTRAAVSRSAAA